MKGKISLIAVSQPSSITPNPVQEFKRASENVAYIGLARRPHGFFERLRRVFGFNSLPPHQDPNHDPCRATTQDQEFMSLINMICSTMTTWECIIAAAQPILSNGGPDAMVYGFLICFFGTLAIALSVGELVSLQPFAGGQYVWTYILGPTKLRRFLSFFSGWLSFWGYQALVISYTYNATVMLRGIGRAYDPAHFFPAPTSVAAFSWPVLIATAILVYMLGNRLSMLEVTITPWHILTCGWPFAALIFLGFRTPAQATWNWLYIADDAWDTSPYVSFNVGLLGIWFAFLGFDAPSYAAETVHEADVNVPRSMWRGVCIEGALGFIVAVAYVAFLHDLTGIILDGTGNPIMDSLISATKLKWLTLVLTGAMLITVLFALSSAISSCVVQIRVLARQRCFIFDEVFVRTSKGTNIVWPCILLVFSIAFVATCLQFAVADAYQTYYTVAVFSTYASYAIPLSLLLYRRLTGQVEFGRWNLGRWSGAIVNSIALLTMTYAVIFACFPARPVESAKDIPIGPLVMMGIFAVGTVLYFAHIRHKYRGMVCNASILEPYHEAQAMLGDEGEDKSQGRSSRAASTRSLFSDGIELDPIPVPAIPRAVVSDEAGAVHRSRRANDFAE